LARGNAESLSAATIRNVMADLAEAGFLEQPHTSAGRVPTAQAYRYYVEQLTGRARLSPSDQNMIQGAFIGINNPQEFMERTSHVLSLVAHGLGVAVSITGKKNSLEHVYFSRLGDHKVLAVVVSKSGLVRDRVLRMETDLSQADLDVAARYLNENFRGWSMEALRQELERQIQQQRSEYDTLMKSIEQLYRRGALASDKSGLEIYMEGAANLIAGEKDSERLRQLLHAVEEKERIAELLGAYLDAKQEAVRVVIGLDQAPPDLRNFVLIGAPARIGDEMMGSLAVIGPARIDYEHAITAVAYIAQLFDRILNEPDQQ
jgi:heat-inducible transcriptional repressor